jgi:hypothetical protein
MRSPWVSIPEDPAGLSLVIETPPNDSLRDGAHIGPSAAVGSRDGIHRGIMDAGGIACRQRTHR